MRLWQCVQRCSVPLSVFFMSFQQHDHSPHAGVVSCLKNKGCHYETNKNLAHHSSYKTQKGSQQGDSGTLNVVWKNRIVWKSIRVRENQISFNTVWGLTADFMRQTHSGKWTFNFFVLMGDNWTLFLSVVQSNTKPGSLSLMQICIYSFCGSFLASIFFLRIPITG